MKAGLGLTYQQYEGVRYLLSHDFNDAQRSHIRRKLAETGDLNLRLIVWLLFD